MLTMFVQSSGTLAFRSAPRTADGRARGDDEAVDPGCCMICGCPGGPCTQFGPRDPSGSPDCPFELRNVLVRRASRSGAQSISTLIATTLAAVGLLVLATRAAWPW